MRRTLSIALVSTTALDGDSAHTIHLRELARALARPATGEEHQVTVYGRREDPAARGRTRLAPGAALVLLEAGPAAPLSDDELLGHVRDLADALRRRWAGAARPDVVHAHGWIAGLVACTVAHEMDIPFVQSYEGLAAGERRLGREVHPARMRLETAVGRGADTVLAAHTGEANALARMGVPRPKISVRPLGVDGEQFTPAGPAMPRGDRPRLVVVARDLTDGGVATAIQALVHAPEAELAIAGGPAREDLENDPVVHRLTIMAKELHVADRVIFLGRLPRRSLPKLLRTARMTLCLSPYQPAPMVAVESMACGVPVLATAVGANADSVLDGITGMHVPAGRPVVVGRAIRRLLAEETTLNGWAIAAADRAHSRYSWTRIANETLRAYDKLLPVPEVEPAAEETEDELLTALAS
ncbi:glycosyltransferase [Actinomadura macrotermitis]|uniref:D-inositol-3-phosphate glycosyltransferase n=1 Tax=Actinomadura macrotermitis TaxID=2585200 RepID=A0A7K0C7S8_9ACTN|nr:glycosyltransferase [Actinomadura macrotermitis]MQY09507.1 D-inositol-3-phosphate glycosyltransferase [Actinomadura macrotermitis]